MRSPGSTSSGMMICWRFWDSPLIPLLSSLILRNSLLGSTLLASGKTCFCDCLLQVKPVSVSIGLRYHLFLSASGIALLNVLVSVEIIEDCNFEKQTNFLN